MAVHGRRRAALAVALSAAAVLVSPVAGALCSDPATQDAYTAVLASTGVCENAVGFTLEGTLTKEQTTEICTTCTALAATTKSKTLPSCNVKNSEGALVTIQSLYDGLFACSTGTSTTSSTSGSKTTDITPVPSPKTSSTPTTNSTSTSHTPTTTPSSLSSGSDSSATTITNKPSTTTKTTPTTTKAPDSSASSNTNGSGSLNQSSEQPVTTSDNHIVMIVGIAGGVVVLVIIIATLLVCRQRRQNHANKLDEVLLSPANRTHEGSTIPGGNTARSQTGTGGGTKSNASGQSVQVPQGGLWDDEVIIAARIPKEKVVTQVLLSRGGYGEVYRGVYNGQPVAIKTLLPETRKNMKQINAFLAEVKLMASLEHERIVSFVGVAWDSLTDLCVVAEYMSGGDLRMALTHFEEVGCPHGFDHDKVKIALHISHALTYLHSLQPVVLHRDLKSKNILLDEALNAKLTDFGVSRERSDRTMTAGVGTSLWMAPEVMMGERYDEKSDIFSFGVVLSELDSHSLPYSQVKESESGRRIPDTAVLQMVSLGKLKVQFSPNAHPEIVALANSCVAVSASDRPTASEVLYRLHSLLKNF